jgi:NAD(P)-dependent dehydrogenase (short-subunit alcohol dehydrogenase family)
MKHVIITGASTGIGKAAALRMAERGFQVWAGVRKDADARAWKGIRNVSAVRLDVAKEDSVVEAAKLLRGPLLDASEVHLVNNAGIAVAGPVEGVPMARWREQLDVNVLGLVHVTQLFLPFIRATRGRLVNISSVSGLATSPYLGPYAASKYAVEAISDALRRELRQFGCRVVVVEPGPIATPIWEKGLGKKEDLLADLSPDLRGVYGRELESFMKGAVKSAKSAVSVDRVSDVIERALTSPNPRTRYVVGTKVLPAAMAITGLLPDKVLDAIVARGLK